MSVGRFARRRPTRAVASLEVGLLVLPAAFLLGAAPTEDRVLLSEKFSSADGAYVDDRTFRRSGDLGRTQNSTWFAEDGSLQVKSGVATTADAQFRMWTRRQDLADSTVELKVTYNGFSGGDAAWRGMNLWLNRELCTPVPSCSAIDDVGGNTGYMLRFIAADGKMVINKKVAGDTRQRYPEAATAYVQGGTYYFMNAVSWSPEVGQTYTFKGSVTTGSDGDKLIDMSVDGEPMLRAVDNGVVGGDPLAGGRVGLRSDYVNMSVDDVTIRASAG